MTNPLDLSRPHPHRNGTVHDAAIAEIDRLLDEDPPAGTESYERLELLSVLVRDDEDGHYPVSPATPQAIVAFLLD